jgi:hypothetical protein
MELIISSMVATSQTSIIAGLMARKHAKKDRRGIRPMTALQQYATSSSQSTTNDFSCHTHPRAATSRQASGRSTTRTNTIIAAITTASFSTCIYYIAKRRMGLGTLVGILALTNWVSLPTAFKFQHRLVGSRPHLLLAGALWENSFYPDVRQGAA